MACSPDIGGGLALIIWWPLFSRAAWVDRLGGLAAIAAAMAVTWPFLEVCIATGAMGFIFPILAMPGICLAFVLWAVTAAHRPPVPRRVSMAVAVLLACGVWTLVRTGGFTGSFENDLSWRWTPTPEEQLLAQADGPLAAAPAPAAAPSPAPDAPAAPRPLASRRQGLSSSPRSRRSIGPGSADATATAWCAACALPRTGRHRRRRRIWRRPVGPGWSSFSVSGNLLDNAGAAR